MQSHPAAALESLLAFWTEAGVDALYQDAPHDRLAEGARRAAPPKPAVVARAPGPVAARPAAIDAGSALREAQRAAAACTTLVELTSAIAAFDGCGLKRAGAARQAVFARGAPEADVMVIGEAPGAEEDVQGRPFVGRSGQLLDRMLAAAGLEGRVFITNTVFWRPPGDAQPSPQDQAICEPFLHRAIVIVKPQVLLLTGGAAAKSVLKMSEGILSLRGRWSEWTDPESGATLPAMATLHPAFLLRQPQAKKKSWSDLMSLRARLDRLQGLA